LQPDLATDLAQLTISSQKAIQTCDRIFQILYAHAIPLQAVSQAASFLQDQVGCEDLQGVLRHKLTRDLRGGDRGMVNMLSGNSKLTLLAEVIVGQDNWGQHIPLVYLPKALIKAALHSRVTKRGNEMWLLFNQECIRFEVPREAHLRLAGIELRSCKTSASSLAAILTLARATAGARHIRFDRVNFEGNDGPDKALVKTVFDGPPLEVWATCV
jgi:hypothetical protein